MRSRSGWLALGGVLLLAFFVSRASSQEEQPMKMPSPDEMKAMMDKWLKTTKPGESHKKLEHFVGSWDVAIKMNMGPGMAAPETKGTATAKWVLDGRFIQEEFKGEMMMPDAAGAMKPIAYQGLGLLGYDNYRNMYVQSWADSLSTHLLSMNGAMDPSGKTLLMFGTMDEPMLDITGRMVKYVTKIIDKDKHVFEIYDLHAGENYRVLEITYTRKK